MPEVLINIFIYQHNKLLVGKEYEQTHTRNMYIAMFAATMQYMDAVFGEIL